VGTSGGCISVAKETGFAFAEVKGDLSGIKKMVGGVVAKKKGIEVR